MNHILKHILIGFLLLGLVIIVIAILAAFGVLTVNAQAETFEVINALI